MLPIILGSVLVAQAGFSSSLPEITPINDSSASEYPIVALLQRHFEPELLPYAYQISYCESRHVHENENGVLKGIVNPKDVGLFQINQDYHLADSKRLGYNIFTLEGNVAYARYLYGHYNWRPWMASFDCWRP